MHEIHEMKTVTDAVRAANRTNSKSSTGPRTNQGKANSSKNAVRHGILSRNIRFETHKQRAEFGELWDRCRKDTRPKGLREEFVVEEIATIFWKLGNLEPLIFRELLRRRELSDGVESIFENSFFHKNLKLPISGDDLPLDRGWDCERMVVRAVAGNDQRRSNTTRGPGVFQGQVVPAVQGSQDSGHQEVDRLEIEAVMGNTLENLTRYQTKQKHDLYRAMEMLRKLQAERRESGELTTAT
jgi:hypothetical protein